jgi:hypothetical protein
MAMAEHRNRAAGYLVKAEEYLASAEDNLELERFTPAAGDAIHAGISAKDAILTILTGSSAKVRNHAVAAKELRQSLAGRSQAASAEKALKELVAAKADVEYGSSLLTAAKAEPMVRRARSLVALADGIVRLGS